jgi:multiple sugar transport system substrate-binding protein
MGGNVMKKLVSTLMVSVLLLAVFSSALAEGKIEFWNDKLTNTDPAILTNLADALQTDSGVQVDIVSYPDVAAYQTAMQQSIKDASAPGMFTWWNGDQLNTLAKHGLLVDLTDEWTNYYIPSGVSADVQAALSYEGKAYAAPYTILNNTVIYNKRAFAKAGIEALPATFDEFLADCEKLKAAGVTPIALKNDSWRLHLVPADAGGL